MNRTRIPPRTMALVRQRYSHCLHCGTAERLTIDHVIPVSRGGDNDPSNLQILCGPCNSSKQNLTMDEWLNGKEAIVVQLAFHSAGWSLREWQRRSGLAINTLRALHSGQSTNPRARTTAAMSAALRKAADDYERYAKIILAD